MNYHQSYITIELTQSVRRLPVSESTLKKKNRPTPQCYEYSAGNTETEVAAWNYTCTFDPFNISFLFLSLSHVRFHIRITVIQRVCPSAPLQKKKLSTSGKPKHSRRNESLLRFKTLIISVQLLFHFLKQCKNWLGFNCCCVSIIIFKLTLRKTLK